MPAIRARRGFNVSAHAPRGTLFAGAFLGQDLRLCIAPGQDAVAGEGAVQSQHRGIVASASVIKSPLSRLRLLRHSAVAYASIADYRPRVRRTTRRLSSLRYARGRLGVGHGIDVVCPRRPKYPLRFSNMLPRFGSICRRDITLHINANIVLTYVVAVFGVVKQKAKEELL